MGTSRSAAQLAVKLSSYANAIPDANAKAVGAGALVVKEAVVPLMAAATGGDLILSRVGRKGARVGVNYKVTPGDNATAIVRAFGPAHLIERDTKPHFIASKRAFKGRKTTRKERQDIVAFLGSLNALTGANGGKLSGVGARVLFNGQWVTLTKPVSSKGKHPFERGVRIAEPKIHNVFAAVHRTELARRFG